MEQLRYALRILQIARNQSEQYFVNPMHVLLEMTTPKHLLTVRLFDPADENELAMGNAVPTQIIAFGFDAMMIYYLSVE
jgi:hypothetical protein